MRPTTRSTRFTRPGGFSATGRRSRNGGERPGRVVLADNNTRVISTYVYKDYDLSGYWASYYKTIIVGMDTPATWDSDPSGSGDGVWDTSEWQAQGTSDRYVFLRWPTVGTAQAISLRFQCFNPSGHVSGQVGFNICYRHV